MHILLLLAALSSSQFPGEPLWLPASADVSNPRVARVAQPCTHLRRALQQRYQATQGVGFDAAGDLRSTRAEDNWRRATLVSVDGSCEVRITSFFKSSAIYIDGAAPGTVTLILQRHEAAAEQAANMDHLKKPDSPAR